MNKVTINTNIRKTTKAQIAAIMAAKDLTMGAVIDQAVEALHAKLFSSPTSPLTVGEAQAAQQKAE